MNFIAVCVAIVALYSPNATSSVSESHQITPMFVYSTTTLRIRCPPWVPDVLCPVK